MRQLLAVPASSERGTTRKIALGSIVILLALICVPNIIWVAHHPNHWVAALVLPLASMAVLFALLGRIPWLACLLLLPFALAAPAEIFYVARYFRPSTPQIIATVASMGPYEAQQYFGWTGLVILLIALLVGLGIALTAVVSSVRAKLRWRGRLRVIVLIIGIIGLLTPFVWRLSQSSAFVTALSAVVHDYGNHYQKSYPFGVVQRIDQYKNAWEHVRKQAAHLANFSFHAKRIEPTTDKRQIYILVIGESSRRSNWQLFGYDRHTTPNLVKRDQLIPLTHFISTWPVTVAAVPMIITRRKPLMPWDYPSHEASILAAMNEAGFETFWISNQEPIGKYASPVSIYATEADHLKWLNHSSWRHPGSYDGVLIPALKRAIASSDKDLFIVLHMMGNHLKYANRYPKSFAKWRPGQNSPQGQGSYIDRTRNSYDNSVLYTDYVLNNIISVLQKSDAVTALWFESDHGEILPTPTCKRDGHGKGTVWGYKIPAFFWYSKAYQAIAGQRIKNLRHNANKRTLSANTFASLIDMAGITFPTQHERWSLFSAQWQYHTRWVAWSRFINFDHSHLSPPCGLVEPNSSDDTRPFR